MLRPQTGVMRCESKYERPTQYKQVGGSKGARTLNEISRDSTRVSIMVQAVVHIALLPNATTVNKHQSPGSQNLSKAETRPAN